MKNVNLKKLTAAGILFISWLFLTLVFIYSKSNITVISKQEGDAALLNPRYSELLKGETLAGRFQASEDYLGQISVRFYNFDRINKDEVDFRLFSGSNLIYEHVYKTDQFLPNELFPFGFPTIPDSKGKDYAFEIESMAGKPEDAITLSSNGLYVSTSYQYPKKLLLKEPRMLGEFLVKKIKYANYGLDFTFSVVEYLVYVSISLFLIYLMFYQLFKLQSLRKIDGKRIILFGLIMLSVSAVFLYLKKQHLSETLSILAFFVILLGVLSRLAEAKVKPSNKA